MEEGERMLTIVHGRGKVRAHTDYQLLTHLSRGRHVVYYGIKKGLDTLVLEGRASHHRDKVLGQSTLSDALLEGLPSHMQ